MASNSLESRGEIEGAKRLLKVAQKWNKSAVAMLLAIRYETTSHGASQALAKLQVSNSEEEVKVAEEYLSQVEQRWQVIDVDDNAKRPSKATATSKRREGETMTATQNTNNSATVSPSSSINQTSTNFDDVIVMDPGGDDPKGSSTSTKVKNESLQSATLDLSTDDDVPYKISIQGCGVSYINGTYTLAGFNDDVPRYSMTKDDGYYHSYYTIQRDTIVLDYKEEKRWLILEQKTIGRGNNVCHYTARADDTSGELPPLNRWKTAHRFVNIKDGNAHRGNKRLPSPTLSHESSNAGFETEDIDMHGEIVNELVVEGCGTGEINGIYKKNGYVLGAPSYFKTRSADGVPCVNIYRGQFEFYCERPYYYWYISVLEDGHWLNYYRTDGSMDRLPLTKGWKSIYDRGASKKPVVQLSTARQTEEESQSNKRIRY